jgi:hypothetical protein
MSPFSKKTSILKTISQQSAVEDAENSYFFIAGDPALGGAAMKKQAAASRKIKH